VAVARGDQILIPLEQQSRGDQPVPVEIFFSSEVGKAGGSALDLSCSRRNLICRWRI
jgi:hypothetical protein